MNAFLGVDDDCRSAVYSDLVGGVGHEGKNAVTSLDGAIAHNEEIDTIKTDFVQDVANTYDSMFLSDTVENLNPALNDWVDESTGGLQTELPSPLKDTTALSFLSAMRYETAWEGQVHSKSIDFTTLSGEKVTVDGYSTGEKTIGWEVDGGTIIELPTRSTDPTYVFYPDDTIDPNELTAEDWNTDDAGGFDVFVTLPAVDFESQTDLVENKDAIALEHLTDSEKGCGLADYSVTENVFITLVIQNTTLRIDDKGIAASAVTQTDAVDGAAPDREAPVSITVDRPYALMTTSESSGWALMYATITDPSTATN
ncbi:serpin family protein [Flaviflexus massiliensis]|uniref:serpin family protein n=1 Tax=Flaviflexus massiliensis TaxID=1522309 RepID=UPI0009EAF11D|nr:serpin family protein [Flaviflexus massiliensis]